MTVSRFERDDAHVPPLWRVELLISSPQGRSFPVGSSVSVAEVDGATPRQIVLYLWSGMREYAVGTITDMLSNRPDPPPQAAIVGQQVALP